MGIRVYKPTSAGRRNSSVNDYSELTTDKPEKSLCRRIKKTGGRNYQGVITTRHRGGGMHNDYVDNLTVANCTFSDNKARYDGGAIYNYESDLEVTNCVFSGNKTGDDGGGIYSSNTDAVLISCTFTDNQASNRGGGIYNYKSGSQVIDCLFSGNHADDNGGAVHNGYKAVKLINCVFAGNSAIGDAGGIYNTYSSSTITNCVVWDNGEAIYNKSCNPHIFYSDIEGCGGSGAGWDPNYGSDEGNNIDIDPCFVDVNNPVGDDGVFGTADDGLALWFDSLCIDAGNNYAIPREIITDIKGDARFNGPADMGAYEFGNLNMNLDSDSDDMPDWFEYRYELDPCDPNDAAGDIDEDALTNVGEFKNNCDPIFFDTDGDLLADGWEAEYGLEPLVSAVIDINDGNNIYADSDSDGLDTLQEVIYGTHPKNPDTDGDTTNDGTEVSWGGLPADAGDGGVAPSASEIVELKLTVGDWSDSRSERYDLIAGPVVHQAPQFGVVTSAVYNQFRAGGRYEIRIVHRGTSPDRWFYPNADYDYEAHIEDVSLPEGVVMQIDDPDGILGTHGEPNTPTGIFDAEGKKAYVNLIKVDMTANDLDGTVAEQNEQDPGAFVHFNLDNDDSSDNTVGAPKHPGADYLGTTDSVTGEDDLKSLTMSLTPLPDSGSVVLSIQINTKIWKNATKGSSNIVLASGSKTWDLSNPNQRDEFQALCSSLWVEGVGTGSGSITLTYDVGSDTIKYTFIAADCGDQPKTEDEHYPGAGESQRTAFENAFPNLKQCEWSITHNTVTDGYNCIAWSVLITSEWIWWQVDQDYGDNDGVIEVSDFDAFYDDKGYQIAAGPSDATIILYKSPGAQVPDNPDGITHAARKRNCSCGAGKWIMFESKCGSWERVEHKYGQLNGSSYGTPFRYYKLK